jgi:hypothetical protein
MDRERLFAEVVIAMYTKKTGCGARALLAWAAVRALFAADLRPESGL